MEIANNMLNKSVKVATGLTDGGPSSLEVTNLLLNGHPFTLIETIGAFQNAEPTALYGHLSPHEALLAFLEAYNEGV